MKEMAMIARRMRLSVCRKMLARRMGDTPSRRPETMAARKHPVPVAESQLKSYRAASGVGLATTGAEDGVVEIRYVPAGRTGARLAIGQDDLECRGGSRVHGELDLGQSPEQDEKREDGEGHPGAEHLPDRILADAGQAVIFGGRPLGAELVGDFVGGRGERGLLVVVIEAPDAFGFPEVEEGDSG